MTREEILKYSKFLDNIAKVDESKRATRLWAVAFEVKVAPNKWKGQLVHLRAHSRANATAQFLLSETRPVHIAGVAPVVGYWVDDKDGLELSV